MIDLDSLAEHLDAPRLEQHLRGPLVVECDEAVGTLASRSFQIGSLEADHVAVFLKVIPYLVVRDGGVVELAHIDLIGPVFPSVLTAVAAVARVPPVPASGSG